MKATAFLIFFAGVLISVDVGVRAMASPGDERRDRWKAKDVKEEIPPPRPSLPLLTLPSFSFPALNFPYLQGFSFSNRVTAPERVRATKTEYVEVTRRQTVHPMCYTAYEGKAPCLPYGQSDFQDYEYDSEEAVHQAQESFVLNEVKKVIHATPVSQITPTQLPTIDEDSNREGRYLEFKLRRNGPAETTSKLEPSEFPRYPSQVPSTEYHTKTVLITKLEKYTDRRVTATLLAINCLPIDRSIPMCQTYPNPIREAPDRRFDEHLSYASGGGDPDKVLPEPATEDSIIAEE